MIPDRQYLDNVFDRWSSSDTLTGSDGNDTTVGGAGNDTLAAATAMISIRLTPIRPWGANTAVEASGGGTDTLDFPPRRAIGYSESRTESAQASTQT